MSKEILLAAEAVSKREVITTRKRFFEALESAIALSTKKKI